MKFLLDENFPKAAITFLQAAGHDVFDFRGTGDEGIDDSEVFQKAQDHAAILLTRHVVIQAVSLGKCIF